MVREITSFADVGFDTLYCILSMPINNAFWIVIFNRISELGSGVRF